MALARENSKLRVRLLGSLAVLAEEGERPLPASRKARILLVLLTLARGPQSRQQLARQLFGACARPRAELRWCLSKLRPVLATGDGPALQADRESVGLCWERIDTDGQRLARLLEQAGREDLQTLLEAERELGIVPLEGLELPDDPELQWRLDTERHALVRLHARLLDEILARLGESDAALDLAAKRVALDPLSGPALARLVTLTDRLRGAAAGRQALAQARGRLAEAGIADDELLAAWRRQRAPRSRVGLERPSGGGTSGATHDSPWDSPLEPAWPLPDRPALAVLPFRDLGGHGDGPVVARGLAADLTSRLARLRGLFVIARGSADRFSLTTHHSAEIGRHLGVRYLLAGSSQLAGVRLRVTVGLIDAVLGEEIWSDQVDCAVDDLFAVQDAISDAVVAAVEPQISHAEMARALALPTEDLSAWESFHRGLWHAFRFTPQHNQRAAAWFRRALQLDPRFARAHAGWSLSCFCRAFLNDAGDFASAVAEARRAAETSIGLDGGDALGHWALGRALFLEREHDGALAALDQALEANPSFALGHYARGFVGTHGRDPAAAIAHLQRAQRHSPLDPLRFAMDASQAMALALQDRPGAAVDLAARATRQPNAHYHIHAIAAACHQLAGDPDSAAASLQVVRRRCPDYSVAAFERCFPHRQEANARVMRRALLAAGLSAG